MSFFFQFPVVAITANKPESKHQNQQQSENREQNDNNHQHDSKKQNKKPFSQDTMLIYRLF